VHGQGNKRPREWVFVKCVLDRRPAIFLARNGTGVDHPTAAANIASLVELVAARPGARVLNCADPDSPTVLEMSRIIARHLEHQWDEVLVDACKAGDPERVLPRPDDPFFARYLDYTAEDRWLSPAQ
jgi:hypothetical protein